MSNTEKNSNIFTITDPALEPYYIQYDQSCYTAIKKIKAGNSDRVRDSILGYYSGLDRCLNAIAEDSIKTRNYESIESYVTTYKNRIEEIKQIKLQ